MKNKTKKNKNKKTRTRKHKKYNGGKSYNHAIVRNNEITKTPKSFIGGTVQSLMATDENGKLLETADDALHFFMKYSTIEFLTAGSGGLIYKCTFQKGPNINSPFVGFRPLQTVEPIHTIILKVIIIHKRGTKPIQFKIDRHKKISVYEDDYDNEIEMQHNIVLDTIDFLEPACPVILYNNKYDTLDTKNGFMNDVVTYFKNKLLNQKLL